MLPTGQIKYACSCVRGVFTSWSDVQHKCTGGAAGPALEALLYATRSLHQGRNMAQRCRVVLKNFLAGLMSRALSGAQGGRVKHALSGVWRKAGRSGIKQRSGIE